PLEPTFLLVLGTCLRQAPTRRQGYLLHSQILGLAFVLRREKSAVRRGQGGSLPEHILMLFQGGQERIRVCRIPLQNFVTAHDPHRRNACPASRTTPRVRPSSLR